MFLNGAYFNRVHQKRPFKGSTNGPHNKGTTAQRQQPALQLVQFLNGRHKRGCTLWGQTKTSVIRPTHSMHFHFRSCHTHFSPLVSCFLYCWLLYENIIIQRYYLTLHKTHRRISEALWHHEGVCFFLSYFLSFFLFLILHKRNVREYQSNNLMETLQGE